MIKVLALFLALIAVCFAEVDYFAQPAIQADMIREINADPESTWKAGINPIFKDMTLADVKKKLLGARAINMIPGNFPAPRGKYAPTDLPASFDARQKWPQCIHAIRNQAQCGSCWAFAASEVLSDRFCIASSGSVNLVLSPQYLVSCDSSDYGCDGGYLANSWQFLQNTGIPTDACYSYTSGGGDSGDCKDTCDDGSAIKTYKASKVVTPSSVEDMQNELYNNGPIEVAFSVYRDFLSYTSGVYQHKTGGLLGGHAVKAIGWGVSNGTPYWIIANSWGASWGMQGFFWIKRGSNECGIESNVITGTPAL
jgi:cathepsin B